MSNATTRCNGAAHVGMELRRKAAQNIITYWWTGRPEHVVVAGTRKPERFP